MIYNQRVAAKLSGDEVKNLTYKQIFDDLLCFSSSSKIQLILFKVKLRKVKIN